MIFSLVKVGDLMFVSAEVVMAFRLTNGFQIMTDAMRRLIHRYKQHG